MTPTRAMIKQCRKLRAKLTGLEKPISDKVISSAAISRQIDRLLRKDGKKEARYIKLLSLGPGEAGKSTLIKQMQLIYGEKLSKDEKMARIKNIRQNIFDSIVAILVAMKEFEINLESSELTQYADCLLSNSQVRNPQLKHCEILESKYLASSEFISHVIALWQDGGVKQAYSRSNEYQLLDCAGYFFERLEDIQQPNYEPTEQDCLRCRVMTTSITETRFAVPYRHQTVYFNVLDVGGQQGDRRRWITLFDKVTAVLFVQDMSSFNQTLREDSKTNRLLESLKVFYQSITTRFLRNVSVLNFMNKIDVLKKKIENGADFGAAIKKIRQEALENAEAFSTSPSGTPFSHHDRPIYKTIADILTENPFDETFKVTEMDRKHFCEAFPTPATDSNHNPIHTFGKRTIDKLKGRTPSLPIEMNEEVIRAACYMKMLLKKIIEKVERRNSGQVPIYHASEFRTYEFHYTCAVDRDNINKVLQGCKNIIVKEFLDKIGIPLA